MPETVDMEAEPEAAAALVALGFEPSPSKLDIFKNNIHLLSNGNTSDFDAWVSLLSSVDAISALTKHGCAHMKTWWRFTSKPSKRYLILSIFGSVTVDLV